MNRLAIYLLQNARRLVNAFENGEASDPLDLLQETDLYHAYQVRNLEEVRVVRPVSTRLTNAAQCDDFFRIVGTYFENMHLVLDLATVVEIDKNGLGGLAELSRSSAQRGKKFGMYNAKSNVSSLLYMIQPVARLPLYDSLDAALRGVTMQNRKG